METGIETEAHPPDSPRFRVAVCAVIEHEGQYLLARRSDIGWWNLPGGGLEYDETVEEGLAREVLEEIGAEVEIARLVGVYSKPRKREVVLSFLCRLAPHSPEPRASEEVAEVAWFAPDAFPTQLLPKHRQRLTDAMLDRPEALLRAQTSSTEEDQRIPPH
jgi:ADP-ribose pyrophosphatase YjhB (NUDIX family)